MITIQLPDRNRLNFKADLSKSLKSIRNEIHTRTGIRPEHQILVLAGATLEDDTPLSYINSTGIPSLIPRPGFYEIEYTPNGSIFYSLKDDTSREIDTVIDKLWDSLDELINLASSMQERYEKLYDRKELIEHDEYTGLEDALDHIREESEFINTMIFEHYYISRQ